MLCSGSTPMELGVRVGVETFTPPLLDFHEPKRKDLVHVKEVINRGRDLGSRLRHCSLLSRGMSKSLQMEGGQ